MLRWIPDKKQAVLPIPINVLTEAESNYIIKRTRYSKCCELLLPSLLKHNNKAIYRVIQIPRQPYPYGDLAYYNIFKFSNFEFFLLKVDIFVFIFHWIILRNKKTKSIYLQQLFLLCMMTTVQSLVRQNI